MTTENTEDRSQEPQSFPSGLKRAWIVALAFLAVAILTPGLLERIQQKGWTRQSSNRGVEFALVRDAEGVVWVSEWQRYTPFGWWLSSIAADGTWTIYPSEGGGFHGPGQALAIDPRGRLWAANVEWLSMRHPDGRWMAYDVSGAVEGDTVTALAVDGQSRAWIGTGKGLGMLSPDGVWSWFTPSNSKLLGDLVTALAVDREDTVWIGTRKGLNAIEVDGDWLRYQESNSDIVDDVIKALAIGQDGQLWVVTNRGYGFLDTDGQWRTVDSTFQGVAAYIEHAQRIWLTSSTSVRIIEADYQTAIYSWSYSGAPRNMDSIVVDAGGRAWIGSRGGLYAFDRSQSLSVEALKRVESIISFLGTVRCLSMASLVLLGVVTIRQLRRKPAQPLTEAPAAAPSDRAVRPDLGVPTSPYATLVQGEILLERGERAEAVAAYLEVYLDGPPDLRRIALEVLERIGEVETF